MSRLPFDPDKMRKRPEPPKPDPRKSDAPMTVTQVTGVIKRVLADKTPSPVRVVGEVSNFSDRRHWYLSLKDEKNVLSCVMWASAAAKAGFTPSHGQQVVATGKLDYYGPQGRLQMYIDRLEPIGQGVLELKLRELCETLRKAGYFADERKKALPIFPRHVAVITSAKGAAVADVIRTAHNRMPSLAITVIDVRVQGSSAAPDIARAIQTIGRRRDALGVDAVILTRGGGSLEDLWAFNEREVADAVFACELPIVAAIGHETDTTVAELVADLRCSTPTQAAERLVPDAEAERHRLDQYAARLHSGMRRRTEQARARLEALARHPAFKRPTAAIDIQRDRLEATARRLSDATRHVIVQKRARLAEMRRRLGAIEPTGRINLARRTVDELHRRLGATVREGLVKRRDRIDGLGELLEAVGPRSVLERGYSYTTTDAGELLRSVGDASAGDAIETHLADGTVRSTVDGEARAKPKRPRKTKKKTAEQEPGESLFG